MGSLISFELLGTSAAEAAARILAGESLQDIPPHCVPNVVRFDCRALLQWKITEGNIPADSQILNEPPYIREAALDWLKKAAEGEPQVFEWRARHKTGPLFWVEVNGKFLGYIGRHQAQQCTRSQCRVARYRRGSSASGSDPGIGFDVESPRIKAGLGLIIMRERLRLVGGSLPRVASVTGYENRCDSSAGENRFEQRRSGDEHRPQGAEL